MTMDMTKFKFDIGTHIVMNEDKDKLYPLIFTISDICYSKLRDEYTYKYIYHEYGMDHYCEGTVEFVENRFQKYIDNGIQPKA